MNLVTAEHLTKSYTERLLFDDTSISIHEDVMGSDHCPIELEVEM